jgi:hypothetical protein
VAKLTSTSDNCNPKNTKIMARTFGRTRKQPTTRGDDFLWMDCTPHKFKWYKEGK